MDDRLSDATCDRCGPAVRAKTVIGLPSGNVLAYCGHCANRFKPAIENIGGYIWALAQSNSLD